MPNRQPKLRKNTHLLTVDGETKSIHAWSKESGISVPTIVKRMQRKWGTLEAIFCPMEDNTFCLARKTIMAHAAKTRVDRKPERWAGEEEQLFNTWAAMMRRCGNEHMIFQQAMTIARDTGQLPEGISLPWMKK